MKEPTQPVSLIVKQEKLCGKQCNYFFSLVQLDSKDFACFVLIHMYLISSVLS